MNFSIELIKNKDLNQNRLFQIVSLKSQHWRYSIEEQVNWIKMNISDDDYHMLLLDDTNYLIGYLSLVHINIKFDLGNKLYLGLGSVCIDLNYKGKGYGMLIMNIAKFSINQIGQPGILLCKPNLNGFYNRAGWTLYFGESYINNIAYKNSVFLTEDIAISELYIEKNF